MAIIAEEESYASGKDVSSAKNRTREKEKRAFSHGCIRVSDPRRLALYILRNQPAWTEQKVDAAMNANKEQYVKVADPVPVFIVYLTSWVDKQGRLNIRHDVYNRDSRLAQMIIDASKL